MQTPKEAADALIVEYGLEPNGERKPAERSLTLVNMDTVEPEEVKWFWPGRIPYGKLTIIGGNPGVGKSYLTLYLAAIKSLGGVFPDGALVAQGNVLLASVEDGLADTIRPRLGKLGANLTRIVYIEPLVRGDLDDGERSNQKDEVFNLDDHLRQLENAILNNHASLLVIDPVMAFMGGRTDTYKDSEIRRVLTPLTKMAEFTGCAIIAVTHPNKKTTESKSLFRMGGSLAFMAVARSGFVVGQDPDNEDRKVFAPTKHNLAAPAPSLAFGFDSEGLLVWEDGECDVTADAAMGGSLDASQISLAKTFLLNTLKNGDVLHREIMKMAASEGISERTLFRAKKLLLIQSAQLDHKGKRGGGPSIWHLPMSSEE